MVGKRCPVRERLRKHYALLHTLRSAKPAVRKTILKGSQKDLITTLGECSLNVLSSNQTISPRCKQVLTRHKSALRKISQPHSKVSWKKKRDILSQRGGFLPALLGSLLTGLLSKMIS